MPRISIVTPCYNAVAYIGQTIESVRQQTFTDWEYVVVDDGSTDGSADAVAAIAAEDERVRLVRQSNAGVHAARNAGMNESSISSEYLAFLDADDRLRPTFLQRLSDHLDLHPEVGLVYCEFVAIDASGDILDDELVATPRYVAKGLSISELSVDEQPTPLQSLMSNHNAIPSCCLYRRSAIAATQGWREFGVEDKDMVIQVALIAVVDYVSDTLVEYRRHEANRSLTNFYEGLDELSRHWWVGEGLCEDDRRLVRNALIFDRRVSGKLMREEGWRLIRSGDIGEGVIALLRGVKRLGDAALLLARQSLSRA